jgi:hypothetical protein
LGGGAGAELAGLVSMGVEGGDATGGVARVLWRTQPDIASERAQAASTK